ncbi:MAG: GerMN domain-containing protein [Defluviitaleaceae bacterium]|nr:GerMN domain-containing protein [Defluviitaleaceae bacterium]
MKKKLFKILSIFLILAFSAALLSACGSNGDIQNPDQPNQIESTGEIMEFFPFAADTMFVYQGDNDERFNQLTFAGFIEGNMMQRIVNQGAITTTEVFKYENGELRLTFANHIVYDFINVMDEPANLDFIILQEPLVVGNSWSMTGSDTTEIVSMDTEVETPHGTFTAMRVVTTHPNGDKTISYFARGVGLVRQAVVWDGEENGYSLFDIVEDTRCELFISMYWLDENTLELNSEFVRLSFATNDDVLGILADVLKTEGENFGPFLTPNTRINGIMIDSPNSILTFDVSSDFIGELNLSSDDEEIKLQMLANTVGNFFMVNRFVITVDGAAYSSDNFDFPTGSYIIVEKIEIDDFFGFTVED